jgi:hypothetical protein
MFSIPSLPPLIPYLLIMLSKDRRKRSIPTDLAAFQAFLNGEKSAMIADPIIS